MIAPILPFMSEHEHPTIERFRRDEIDAEDLRLRAALSHLQGIVLSFLQRTGQSINELTQEEQQRLVDQIRPHLAFELDASDDIYRGMPIVVEGCGAFLATDDEGSLLGAQVTKDGDVLTGVIDTVQAYPVPSREIVLRSDQNDSLPTYDQSLSAVVVIDGAHFYTGPDSDGVYQAVHDLTGLQIVVPVVYGMPIRMVDITQ